MNYSLLLKQKRAELFSAFQYKELNGPLRVLAVIATLGFWIGAAGTLVVSYIFLFGYQCVASSSNYLECWVKDNRRGINPITEAVLYLVTMPFIFLLRCILSLFSIVFFFFWFMLNCYGYIASLGSIEWQPFISDVDLESRTYFKSAGSQTGRSVVVIIGFSMLCLAFFFGFISGLLTGGEGNYEISQAVYNMGIFFNVIQVLFMIIAVPVAFRKVAVGVNTTSSDKVGVVENNDEDQEDDLPEF
jgi:hypothetical protein